MPMRRRYSSRRRYTRRIPGSTTYARKTSRGRDFPTFAVGQARRLVRVFPTVSPATDSLALCNAWAGYGGQVMNEIAQGTSTEQRVGNRIFMRTLIVDFTVNFTNRRNLTPVPNTPFDFRVAVIYDRRPTGTMPTVADVFDDSEPLAFPRQSTRDRFDILYLRTITSNPITTNEATTYPAAAFGFHGLKHRRISIPIRRPASWKQTSTTGVLADIVTGALYFCLWSFEPYHASNPTIYCRHKLSFTDYV